MRHAFIDTVSPSKLGRKGSGKGKCKQKKEIERTCGRTKNFFFTPGNGGDSYNPTIL